MMWWVRGEIEGGVVGVVELGGGRCMNMEASPTVSPWLKIRMIVALIGRRIR